MLAKSIKDVKRVPLLPLLILGQTLLGAVPRLRASWELLDAADGAMVRCLHCAWLHCELLAHLFEIGI